MNYNKEISEKIGLVNKILDEINHPHILENQDFSVDEMSMESWLKINLKNQRNNNIPLSLTFTPTGLEVRLDRVVEAIDWSNRDLKDASTVVNTILKNVFTSHILVEYYGSSQTRISLFGHDGRCTHNFKYREGLSLKRKRIDRLYYPIYAVG